MTQHGVVNLEVRRNISQMHVVVRGHHELKNEMTNFADTELGVTPASRRGHRIWRRRHRVTRRFDGVTDLNRIHRIGIGIGNG